MNYQIIADEELLKEFIYDFLPTLGRNQCYYFCLFARSKYAKNEDGSNQFPHIKTDKNQLKRFVCSSKDRIIPKIKQLQCEFGAYLTKDGDPVPQESLALYVTPNPRDMQKAMWILQKRLIDIHMSAGEGYSIYAEALSAIQKASSKTIFVDFDIDSKDPKIFSAVLELVKTYIKPGFYFILETRGGYHFMIDPSGAIEEYKNKWYKELSVYADQTGDNQMIPVPGTYQGGFIPRFIY